MSYMEFLSDKVERQFDRSLGDIITEMNDLNCGSWSLTIRDKDENAVASLILVSGEQTQAVIDAVDKVTDDDDQ